MNATWKVRWDVLSLLLLFLFVLAHLLALFAGIKYGMPATWARQWAAGWLAIVLMFFGVSILNCFLEWGVHRCLLHTWIVTWLKRFCRNHRKHHGLTPISVQKSANPLESRISSRYFLDEKGDWFNVSFADYSLLVFLATETVFILPFQLLFPRVPFLAGGYLAVACSYMLYEMIHPLEHRPKEWWDARASNPFWFLLGLYVSRLRRRHQYHHLHPRCNLAIMGFFGYPLADKILKTDKLPPDILYDNAIVKEEDLAPPQPRQLVVLLDRWALARERRFVTERG